MPKNSKAKGYNIRVSHLLKSEKVDKEGEASASSTGGTAPIYSAKLGPGGFSPGENFEIGNRIWRIFNIFGKLNTENFNKISTI